MKINPIVNNSDMNEAHRSVIVKILQQKEICTRAEIAKLTGLTQASITKIVSSLIDMGIVLEVGSIKGNGNRRAIGLRLNSENNKVIGIKLSRSLVEAGVFDISGKNYSRDSFEFDMNDDPAKVLSRLKANVHEMLDEHENIVAVGMAIPGPYLRKEGNIAIVTRMTEWHNVNFLKEFKDEFKRPIFIEQDANAGAMAEWWFGDHEKPVECLAYMLVGEGVGSGIVENEKLILGHMGTASEVGHMSIDVHGKRCECGNYGCLEMYCSAPVMLQRAKEEIPEIFLEKSERRTEEHEKIFEAARAGNEKARALLREMAEYISYGCVNLINAYNPDIIIIGDVLSKAGDLILPDIKRFTEERAIKELYEKTEIKISELEVDPTLYGAAAIATERVLRKPSEYLTKNEEGGGNK